MTTTLTSPVLFTLITLLTLSACGNADDSNQQDDTNCTANCDSDMDTADPPVTMQLAYLISELGTPLGDVIDTHLGDQNAKSGDGSLANTVLTLEAGKLTWLTAGDANNLVEGEVTPKFEDDAGLWATMPKQLYFDDVAGELDIYSPTYSATAEEPEAPLSVYPVPAGVMNLAANLNLWFDLGAVTCHYDSGDGYTNDYDQSDLIVEYGYMFEVAGVTDGDVWLEIDGDQLQLAGAGTNSTITSSSINQKDGIVQFTDNRDRATTCQ